MRRVCGFQVSCLLVLLSHVAGDAHGVVCLSFPTMQLHVSDVDEKILQPRCGVNCQKIEPKMGPKVGEGLQIHPGSTLIGRHDEKVEMWKGATQGAYYHPPHLPGVLPHTFSAPS